MRIRSISLAAAVTMGLLAGCDGANSSVGTEDLSVAGTPNPSVVVTKGKTAGNPVDTGSGDTTVTPTPNPTAASIVGTWTGTNATMSLSATFASNGVGSYIISAGGTEFPGALTWTGSGSTYQVTIDGTAGTATVSGKKMTLVDPDGMTWNLTKK